MFIFSNLLDKKSTYSSLHFFLNLHSENIIPVTAHSVSVLCWLFMIVPGFFLVWRKIFLVSRHCFMVWDCSVSLYILSQISPPFQGKKVNKLPTSHPYYSSLHCINHDYKTSCGLIQDGLFTSRQFRFVIDLIFSTLYSRSLWRTETIVFAKLNKPPPPLSNKPLSLLSPHSNVVEINKYPMGA